MRNSNSVVSIRGSWLVVVALAMAVYYAPSAAGQSAGRSESIQRQIFRAFDENDYQRAVELIEKHLERSPNDPTMLYNLACAQCRLDKYDDSAEALLRAFKAGFRDFDHMRSDPDLKALRDHPTFKTIMEEVDKAAAMAARSVVDRWRDTYGVEHYRYEKDEERHLNYATALDETSHQEMRQMLERQADQMIKTLFDEAPNYDVLIAVPTPEDADKFFKGDQSVGGVYQHDARRLVARDIGGSLRHEFVHLMHYGHMERLRQRHPLWIQEGLAALYEDYELSEDGTIKFLPNYRQPITKARAKAGILIKWKDLMAMSADAFMDKAVQMYPQARSIFEFLADEGRLELWYRMYILHYDEDRTGTKAFELAFEQPLAEVEREWRKWVVDQPTVDFQIMPDDAALGIRTRENSSNDGVLVTGVVPGSAAALGGIRKDDVIVALAGQATRSILDMRRFIGAQRVGQEVEVRARRGTEYFTTTVILRPAFGGS